MTPARVRGRVEQSPHPAVRHLRRAVRETLCMYRGSDRSERRVRVRGEWAA